MSTAPAPPSPPSETPPVPSPEEIATTEELTAELAKAAQTWEEKADEETHSAAGSVSKEMLYRATESGMRQAMHAMEEKLLHDHEHEAEVKKERVTAEEGGSEAQSK